MLVLMVGSRRILSLHVHSDKALECRKACKGFGRHYLLCRCGASCQSLSVVAWDARRLEHGRTLGGGSAEMDHPLAAKLAHKRASAAAILWPACYSVISNADDGSNVSGAFGRSKVDRNSCSIADVSVFASSVVVRRTTNTHKTMAMLPAIQLKGFGIVLSQQDRLDLDLSAG